MKKGCLTILGMGPGDSGYLTMSSLEIVKSGARVILRTAIHPTVKYLDKNNIKYESCDYLYESRLTFEEVYASIVEKIKQHLMMGESVVYVVPGSPSIAEKTVEQLIVMAQSYDWDIVVQPAVSFFELMCNKLQLDPGRRQILLTDAMQLIDASSLPYKTDVIFMQVYNNFVASELKLTLLERFTPECEVVVAQSIGVKGKERFYTTALCDMDRNVEYDYLTSVYMPFDEKMFLEKSVLQPIIDIMSILRGENGCVWDKEQNHFTLKRYLVEETYEVLEAIEQEDPLKLCDELGDLLLQVIFHARIAEETGEFTIEDVVGTIVNKMIRRHPHVFSDVNVNGDPKKVLLNWEKIKEKERANGKKGFILDDIPVGLPSLMRALKMQEKVAKYGFDWPKIEYVWDKVYEELKEFKETLAQKGEVSYNICEKEIGDVLFSVVNLARFAGFDPETALAYANNVFMRRFAYVEEMVGKSGKSWKEHELESLDILWSKAKALNL